MDLSAQHPGFILSFVSLGGQTLKQPKLTSDSLYNQGCSLNFSSSSLHLPSVGTVNLC